MVSTFDLDMGVSFERSAFMGYLGHSAVTPALRATPLWRVASDPGAARSAPGERSGTELSGGPAADGHKCAGWTDPDRAPPACELYNSLGGLRNIPLSFSACCVTGNALLRPSERPPAPAHPWRQRARAVPHEHHDNPYRMRLTHTSTRCLSFAGIFRSRPWPASLHPRARLPGPALVP